MRENVKDIVWKVVYTLSYSLAMFVPLKLWAAFNIKRDIFYLFIFLVVNYIASLVTVKKTKEKYPKAIEKARWINLVIFSIVIFILFYFLGFVLMNWFYIE